MSPFPTIVLSLLCVIAFLPGESAIKLLISSSKPGNHFARGGSPVMMASINPNKTPHKVISEVCSYFNDKCPFCQFFLPYPGLVRQHLRGRWLQLEGKETMRKCLRREVSQVRRHEELLPITSLYRAARGFAATRTDESFSNACRYSPGCQKGVTGSRGRQSR